MIAFEHRKVYNEVFGNDYFVELFNHVCEKYGGPGEAFGLQNPEKINSFWNDFLFALPDNRSIRREPFNAICDLAEGSYLGEDDGEC